MEQTAQLIGIARLAAEGTLLAEKRRVEYRTLPTRKWLNRCISQRVPFHWTVNPYRGCEFGCKYCYARYTHEFLERRELDAFETEIYAKEWDAHSFRAELKSIKEGQAIGIGTATDPYQPAERKFRRTRQVLEAMLSARNMAIYITTKSNLVTRDLDLLSKIQERNRLHVTLTVTTMDRGLARLTEPYAPRPDLRMQAVAELAQAGIPVGVIASPVLPLVTDSKENLRSVAKAAKEAGAGHFGAHVLFLEPSTQRVFFPFIAEQFPEHYRRYQVSYAHGAYLKGTYPERIQKLVESIRAEVGIRSRELDRLPVTIEGDQMKLF